MKEVTFNLLCLVIVLATVGLLCVSMSGCAHGEITPQAIRWGMLPEAVVPAEETEGIPYTKPDFGPVEIVKIYDGDTITVELSSDYPAVFAHKLGVRVYGIDTPEMRGKTPCEKKKALEARDLVRAMVGPVNLYGCTRGKYFRIVCMVLIGGKSVAQELIEQNLAVPYYGKTKQIVDWCSLGVI